MRDLIESVVADLWLTSTRGPVGVGVDIEEVARWRAPGPRLDALFAPEELAHIAAGADQAERAAAMWCAKEAAFKAASGRLALSLRDIVVHHASDGAPSILIRGADRSAGRVLVSMSHSREYAVAVAVFVESPIVGSEGTEEVVAP